MKINKRILILIKAISITAVLFSQLQPVFASKPLIVDEDIARISLSPYVDHFADKDNSYTIEKIISESIRWEESKNNNSYGLTSSVYWFRFTLTNKSESQIHLYLEEAYPLLDSFTLYKYWNKRIYTERITGDRTHFGTRDLKVRNFVFNIILQPGETTYYLKVKNGGAINVPLIIWNPQSYIESMAKELPIMWMYYGLMLIMVIYNLVVFISVRESSYFYYIMTIISIILLELTLNGYAFQYLWPNSIWWANNCLPVFGHSAIVFMSLFFRSYIQTRKYFPVINRLIFILVGLGSAGIVLSMILEFSLALKVLLVITAITCAATIVFSVITALNKSREGMFFLIAFLLFLFGCILYVFQTINILPLNLLTEYSIQIGSSFIVILLSLGLADRLNILKNRLVAMNINLESTVNERTTELTAAMEEMNAINENLLQTKDALWGEMQLAKKIQTILLPKSPLISGYEISAYMNPAAEVGGDYYDIINADGYDWIVIGDVSGHGVPAGLVMMMVQTAVHSVLEQNPSQSPAALLSHINRSVSKNIKLLDEDKYMTITVFLGIENGEFIFSGLHQDILIYRSDSGKIDVVETTGTWIGIQGGVKGNNIDSRIKLNIGDTMLVYTDGITEAWEKGSVVDNRTMMQMFGVERLVEALLLKGSKSTDEIKNYVIEKLKDYDCMDDVTMLIIKRLA